MNATRIAGPGDLVALVVIVQTNSTIPGHGTFIRLANGLFRETTDTRMWNLPYRNTGNVLANEILFSQVLKEQ